MSDPEKRVFDAFQSLEVPEGLNERTLATIEARRKKRSRGSLKQALIAIAACFCLAFVGIGGYAYATPTAYVDVEADPHIQLTVNRFNIVVGASAIDPKGEEILASHQVVGKNYEEALASLDTASPTEEADDAELVAVSIACDDASQARALQNQTEQCLGKQGGAFTCGTFSTAEHDEAHHAGMGAARYAMAKRLVELGGANSIEECQNMSMHELRALVSESSETSDPSGSTAAEDLAGSEGTSAQTGSGRHHGAHHGHN